MLSTIYSVTTNSGTGAGTLYDAITQVNSGGYDTINFQLPQAQLTISLESALSTIVKPVTIDGYSENSFLGSSTTTPLVVIQDSTPTSSTDGLVLGSGSDGSKIDGLDITGFTQGSAIRVQSAGNQIVGNFIGTDTTGSAAGFGGGNLTGIMVTGSNNTIGGSGANGNIVAFNTGAASNAGGIVIDTGTGNTITQNSIFQNTIPILLLSGGNNNLAAPVLTSAMWGTASITIVQGTFNAPTDGNYTLEFFASQPSDPATAGQAHTYLASETLSATAGSNSFSYSLTTPSAVHAGQRVTATATAQTSGDTSALSSDQTVAQATPSISVNPVNITYGTALANSQLVGTATVNVGGNTINVSGTFTYTSSAGAVLGAGDGQSEAVTFTPDDLSDYTTASSTVIVNVAKATPSLSIDPVNITYGTALANSQLSGSATWSINGNPFTVFGAFTYTTAAGTILNAGNNQSLAVTFTPTDTTNYTTASGVVVVNVAQATPVINVTGLTTTFSGANSSHPATGTAYGVLTPPENLTSYLQLSYQNTSTGTISSSAPVNAGTYQVLASFSGNPNYQTITQQNTGQQVVITPAATEFANLSNPTVVVGTILTSLTGEMISNTEIPTGTVTVSFYGAVYTAPVKSDGTFVVLVPTAKLGPGIYTAQYSYSGSTNYAASTAASNTTLTLGVTSLLNNNIVYSQGSIVPISIMIVDTRGVRYKSKHRVITATGIVSVSDPSTVLPLPAGARNKGRFASDSRGVHFSYRLGTTGLKPGAYMLIFSSNDDPLPHSLTFIIGSRQSTRG